MQRSYAHEIVLDRPPAEAIELFTPKGEEAWVPDWTPDYVTPSGGETREEMIFTTGHDGETTYWTCLRWRPRDGHARYLRLTPPSRVAFVDVQCRAESGNRTRVHVEYQIHALSKAGRNYLEIMTQDDFSGMIDQWADLIAVRCGAP